MNVCINNVDTEVADTATVFDVPQVLGLTSTAGIAIAVNETIVPRQQWADARLQSSDKIILIRATQGG